MFIIMLHIITRRLRIIMIMLMLPPQVILKDSVGITSFGTVSRISRQCLRPCNAPPQQVDCSSGLLSLMQVRAFRSRNHPARCIKRYLAAGHV